MVTATGTDTEIGQISQMLGAIAPLTTPLLAQINRFGRQITVVALAVAAALFVFADMVRGYDWLDALMTVVALAVYCPPAVAETKVTLSSCP